jgi:hypothetical protein
MHVGIDWQIEKNRRKHTSRAPGVDMTISSYKNEILYQDIITEQIQLSPV